ncbi:MAG: hypothetical protein AB7O59_05985 [Pirellulales bacterium]
MTWLLESPWPAITLGVVLELALGIALVRTGRGMLLVVMAAVLLGTLGLVLVERLVVTEREAVENTLEAAAAALETNDPAAVLALFTPDSPRRAQVTSALARYRVRAAHIGGDLEVASNRLTIPPSARAYFTGRVEGSDSRGDVPYDNLIAKFKVTLHPSGDGWLIHDFEMSGLDGLPGRSGSQREP